MTLTFRCECAEARWVDRDCPDPTAAAGAYMQKGRSAPVSSPPVLARVHGPIAVAFWLHTSSPRSRVQPPPLFAPPLSATGVPPYPNLTVTQHFSARIAREGPAVSVRTPPPSTSLLQAEPLRRDLTCAVATPGLPRLIQSRARARGHSEPHFRSHSFSKSTSTPTSK